MKVCTKCGARKELDQFHRDNAKPDGRAPSCKVCKKAAKQIYYKKNKAKLNEYSKRYIRAHPELMIKAQQKFHATHPNYEAEKSRRYQQAFPERNRAKAIRYYVNNRDAILTKQRQKYHAFRPSLRHGSAASHIDSRLRQKRGEIDL